MHRGFPVRANPCESHLLDCSQNRWGARGPSSRPWTIPVASSRLWTRLSRSSAPPKDSPFPGTGERPVPATLDPTLDHLVLLPRTRGRNQAQIPNDRELADVHGAPRPTVDPAVPGPGVPGSSVQVRETWRAVDCFTSFSLPRQSP